MYNFIDIQFPGTDLPAVLSYRTVFMQDRYEHEQISMYVKNWGLDYSRVQPGTPISVTIKTTSGSREFQGYVHAVTPDLSAGKHFVQLVALGASYVMKQANQRVWTNVTADQAVAEIAKSHGFAYSAMPHPRVYSHLVQAGISDWAFLVNLAKECGYTLRAENTTLHFDEIDNDYKTNVVSARRAILRDANNPNGMNMFKFTPEISETADHGGAVKAATAVGGVSLESASGIVQTNQSRPKTTRVNSKAELFDRFNTKAVIPNSNVANSVAIAADARAKYPYRGKATLLGDATLRPDLPIYLDGIGRDYSGYWTILGTEHIFEEYLYTTEVLVGTDSLGTTDPAYAGTPVTQPPSVPQRVITPNVAQTNKKPVSKLITNAKMVNGKTKATGFGVTTNRPQPKINTKTATSSPKWASTSSNIRTVPAKTNLSAAAVAKLRGAGVR